MEQDEIRRLLKGAGDGHGPKIPFQCRSRTFMANSSYPLPQFIRKNLDPISEEWWSFAKTLAVDGTSDLVLRDHIHPILFYIADDIETSQTAMQQEKKSHGKGESRKASPGAIHAALRYSIGFNLVEMISEYRALRATVIKLWTKTRIVLTDSDVLELIRFNEAIDQLLAQSVAAFMEACQLKLKTA